LVISCGGHETRLKVERAEANEAKTLISQLMLAGAGGPAQPTAAPGWYGDPWKQADQRWWDGRAWTEHTT
jgi:hypothetical protein